MTLFLALFLSNAGISWAASQQDMLKQLTASEPSAGNSMAENLGVAQNIANMDTDHNGFADVAEVRAYLALKHGADYQKEVLDRWELAAKGKSCGTSLIKVLSNN